MTAVRMLTPAMRLAALLAVALGVLVFWLLAARYGTHVAAMHVHHALRALADPLMHYHG